MKKVKIISLSVGLFFLSVIVCFGESLYQVGTLQALLKGLYHSTVTVKVSRQHADTGVGCGVGVGEVIALDGYYFCTDEKGYTKKLSDKDGLPFFTGAKFKPTIKYTVRDITSIGELEKTIEQHTKSDNIFYLIRVDGFFREVYARSEDRIKDPAKYKPLLEWMETHQNKYYFKGIKGTLVAVKSPDIIKNIGVPGYHVHFINNTRSVGGHVFDVQIENGSVEIQPLYSMNLILPRTKEFLAQNMFVNSIDQAGLHKLEAIQK